MPIIPCIIFFELIYLFKSTLNKINFVKINISNPNTKSETKNYIQHVLQVYILCTCHEITQVAPPSK
jgi:hypothetical protein